MQLKKKIVITIFFLLIITLSSLYYFSNHRTENTKPRSSIKVTEILSGETNEKFSRAIKPIEFQFPKDYGFHPKFKNEWWYFTGNVKTETGRLFGFQFTIFRNALSADSLERKSSWATNQFYMAHFAVTDVSGKMFYAFERFSRGAIGLAGVQLSPLQIWLEDWQIEIIYDIHNPDSPTFHIRAEEKNISVDFFLTSTKPLVLHGNRGLSQKGRTPGNASYYYSLTRLKTTGKIQQREKVFDVYGESWLDREWSTSALDKDQVGWDWFSLQLENGLEIMYYQIRNRNGQPDKFSKGTLIEKNGTYRTIEKDEIELTVVEYWESPLGNNYPSKWQMKIPKEKIELEIIPNLNNQELPLSVRYWEGSVSVNGLYDGQFMKGLGYVEMTGYAQ